LQAFAGFEHWQRAQQADCVEVGVLCHNPAM
jgi:hypothetical protein